MNTANNDPVRQLLHQISLRLTETLSRWLERPATIVLDDLVRLPFAEAVSLLGADDQPVVCCCTDFTGPMRGCLVLAFEDRQGRRLAGLLANTHRTDADNWSPLATSAMLETANILGSAYLNCLSELLSDDGTIVPMLPAPPVFKRDYPACLMQSVLLPQATSGDTAVFNRTRLNIGDDDLHGTLLFIPDADTLRAINDRLIESSPTDSLTEL